MIRRIPTWLTVGVFCGFMLMPLAKADIANMLEKYDHGTATEKSFVKAMLMATEAGFSAANAELRDERGQTPLYCAPDTVSLSGEQLIEMLRRWVEAKRADEPRIETGPMPTALLFALEDAFPCTK